MVERGDEIYEVRKALRDWKSKYPVFFFRGVRCRNNRQGHIVPLRRHWMCDEHIRHTKQIGNAVSCRAKIKILAQLFF